MSEAGTDFNPDSPKQLADVLFNRLNLKSVKKTKTGHSTDVEVLEKLAAEHAVPKLILEYRSLVKLKNTYLDNLTDYVNPKTGRIHASFNQIGAATGRLSCSETRRTFAIVFACCSCVPCEKLMRATSSPASISSPTIAGLELTGPRVQTILVRSRRGRARGLVRGVRPRLPNDPR